MRFQTRWGLVAGPPTEGLPLAGRFGTITVGFWMPSGPLDETVRGLTEARKSRIFDGSLHSINVYEEVVFVMV